VVTTGPEGIVDSLGRSRIFPPQPNIETRVCIATVASGGFAEMLDDLLGSLRLHGDCADATIVVFLIDDDPASRSVALRHGARIAECASVAGINTAIKAALYSVAEVIGAEQFVCLDADMLVLASLQPVLAALDVLPDDAILCCTEGDRPHYRDLEHALLTIYGGVTDDFGRLLGDPDGEPRYPFVVNDGFFAASRRALIGLSETLRSMRGVSEWLDERPDIWWRNQFIFNLALARRRCGMRLHPSYNVQLHVQEIDIDWSAGRARALSNGEPVRVVHFNGVGRNKRASYRSLLGP
jgi:hypothetical protein